MNAARRTVSLACAIVALAAMLGRAEGQLLRQVREDALVVVKLNNPEMVNQRVGEMSQRIGLANLNPGFKDPLGLLRQRFNLKEGINWKGEAALVIFRPVAGEREPRAMALIPVHDYRAFVGNFLDPGKEGDADTFRVVAEGDPLYCENWGGFAAVSPWKELLQEAPQGLKVEGTVARQLAEQDLAVYVNMRAVRDMILPAPQQIRMFLQNAPPMDPNLPPEAQEFQRAVAIQVLGGVETFLNEAEAACYGLTISPTGLVAAHVLQFSSTGSIGKQLQGVVNTDRDLLGRLPQDRYLIFGGWSLEGANLWNLLKDFYGAMLRATPLPEAQVKVREEVLAAMEQLFAAGKEINFAMIAPELGAPPKGLLRGVSLMQGDARAILEANRKLLRNQDLLMRNPGSAFLSSKTTFQEAAATVEGVTVDQYRIEVKIDPDARRAGADVAQLTSTLYAVLYGDSVFGFQGMLDDKTLIGGVGLQGEGARRFIAGVKSNRDPLSNSPLVKSASERLPKKRVGVLYVAADSITNTVLDVLGQMGLAKPMKVPEGLPPVSLSVGTEGSALRIDAVVPSQVIETWISLGIQIAIQQQMRGGRGGPQ